MKSRLTWMFAYLLIGLSSCKKDNPQPKDDPQPTPSMVGFWQGKYGASENYPTNGYAFLFREDGTVRVFNGTDTTSAAIGRAEGIYVVLGSTVTTKYTYLNVAGATFSTSGTVNASFTFLEGTWGPGTILPETVDFLLSSNIDSR